MSLPDAEERLCLSCGMCCNGALYDRALLKDEEIARAEGYDLPLTPFGHPPRIGWRQPCPKLAGTACTIYADRPIVCRTYACKLLQGFRKGDVTLEDALAATATASQLTSAAVATLEPGQSLPELRLTFGSEPRPLSPREAEQRLRVAALDLFLDRHFRRANEHHSFGMADTGSEEKVPE